MRPHMRNAASLSHGKHRVASVLTKQSAKHCRNLEILQVASREFFCGNAIGRYSHVIGIGQLLFHINALEQLIECTPGISLNGRRQDYVARAALDYGRRLDNQPCIYGAAQSVKPWADVSIEEML